MEKPKIVLGFVGKLCAGKGFAISYLVDKYGFYASSCSDRIREEIKRQGLEITRERLQEIGGKMRQQFGPAVLAQRTWESITESGVERAIIDSIRGQEEVDFFKTQPNFYLIAIDADPKIRFERIVSRAIQSDPITWEVFQKTEERDLTGDGRNIEACIKEADFHIENNGTPEELYQKLDELLKTLPI